MILQRAAQDARTASLGGGRLIALILISVIGMLAGCEGSYYPTMYADPAQLTSIAVGPPDSNVPLGLVGHFKATGIYSNGVKTDLSTQVAWRSMNTTVVLMGGGGVATTVSPGATMIMATLGRVSGSTSLTVTPATLMSIGVTPANPSIASGLTEAFSATGIYSDHTAHDLTSAVTWSSSNSAVASVNNSAGTTELVTAQSPGSTTITATLGAVSASTNLTVTAATLVSIGVTPTNPTLAKGLTTALKASGVYTDHSTQDLTATVAWSSSAPAVATMANAPGSNGVVSALSQGSAQIMAAYGGLSGSTMLTVSAATLVSIGVTPPNPNLAKGLKTQFTAMGTYTDNTIQNLTAAAVWSSSDPTLASVSNAAGFEGQATALNPGSVTITATMGTIQNSSSLTISPATLVSIAVTPANPSIANGLGAELTATGTYTDNSTQNLTAVVAWESSAATVASVSNAAGSNGLAMSVGPGSATITASSGAALGSTVLTVTPATLVSIAVTPANPSVANGLSTQFIATGTYTDNSTQNLTSGVAWSSSDTTVASVSNASGSNGLAVAVGTGSATITAASGAALGSTTLTVTPATLVSIAVTPANPSIANGTTQQFTATGTYTDNSTQNLTAAVTWNSTDPGVAAVSNATGSNGLATTGAQGSATISAALGGVSGSTGLTVTAATLVSLTVIPANPSIANGTSQQFAATGTYTDGSTQPLTAAVTWASSNTSVATLSNAAGSNGLASSAGQGTSIISATLGSVSGGTLLAVTPSSLVSIAVTPANASIASGTSQQFTATGTYTDGSMQNLTTSATWNSSAPSIAAISNAAGSNGLAVGGAVGGTSIGAALGSIVSPTVTLTVTAAPEYAYVTNQNDNTVSEYVIGAGGALSLIGTVATGNEPNAVAVDPAHRYVYVANWTDDSISEYAVGAGGTLSNIGTIAAGSNPASLDVDTTGQYVYAANLGSNTVSQYAIGTGGVLTALGNVTAAGSPISVNVDPTGKYLYVAGETGNVVYEYSIGAGGLLTSLGTVATGNDPQYVIIDPTGRYAYVANWNDATVSEYTVNSNGTLTAIGTIASGNNPETVVVDPSGRYVYAENWGSNTVSQYAIGTSGALSSIGTLTTGSGPWFLSIDPTGSDVYVVNFNDSTVSEYTIGTGGALTAIGTVSTGSGPNAITSD
jgi:6-phosphogluconolactonase (cycloisomerase 2 family)